MRRAFATVGAVSLLAACMVVWVSAAGDFGSFEDPEQRRFGRFFRGSGDDDSSDDDDSSGGRRTKRAFRDIIGSVQILGCGGASGVDVYIAGESFFVRTGSSGNFRLSNVPTSTYEIVVQPPGQDLVVLAGIIVGPPARVVDLGVISLPGPDLQNDPNNCGVCGLACSNDNQEMCVMGVCTSPPDPPACGPDGGTDCNGVCVDIQTDPANCGQCGQRCGIGELCAGGQCQIDPSQCQPGETQCGASCVDISSDPSNCGECGLACANNPDIQETCVGGVCTSSSPPSACPPWQNLCNGACVNFLTDPRNCGGCGAICLSGFCSAGSC